MVLFLVLLEMTLSNFIKKEFFWLFRNVQLRVHYAFLIQHQNYVFISKSINICMHEPNKCLSFLLWIIARADAYVCIYITANTKRYADS